MQTASLAGPDAPVASTTRIDRWWLAPFWTAVGLALFFGDLTLRAFKATHVWYDPYISPTVLPPVFTPAFGYPGAVPVDRSWVGAFPAWRPAFPPQSPAFVLPGLASLPVHLLLLPR